MRSSLRLANIVWGHVALVTVFAAITIFYLADAWQASSRVKNLILVLPASALALVLCVVVLGGIVKDGLSTSRAAPDDAEAEGWSTRLKTPLTMVLFAAYIATLPWIGFDAGTALFMAAMLFLDGERSPLPLIGLPIVFALVVTASFQWLLPYPMPMLFL